MRKNRYGGQGRMYYNKYILYITVSIWYYIIVHHSYYNYIHIYIHTIYIIYVDGNYYDYYDYYCHFALLLKAGLIFQWDAEGLLGPDFLHIFNLINGIWRLKLHRLGISIAIIMIIMIMLKHTPGNGISELFVYMVYKYVLVVYIVSSSRIFHKLWMYIYS